ncbi:hypothetical protein GCM10025865_11410 [Paraoerskovia sediminicola]|uniref:DUF1905 domain-containing protein n=1 Tax=Paraoerskovia sediminicola TaxID=1138587 RepID=A0ABM8G1G1_9CELL|nr:DUF1905 domain-containing protein [Paraoerskovia sediminicola]BDZ41842.1 hypothetical protein GCM10025865_11410 [Paraoerskovia sediminicola]
MRLRFEGEIWEWESRTSWYFVTVPENEADALRDLPLPPKGFGSIKVEATVGGSTWRTSVFPQSADGTYVLPLKKSVRTAEDVGPGDRIAVELRPVDL